MELLTDVDMLSMIERGIRKVMCHTIHQYKKASNKYIEKDYNQDKESSYLMYWDVNNLHRWAAVKKSFVDGFKWRNGKSNFDKKIVKILIKIVTKDTYLKEIHRRIYHFY